MDVEGQVEGRGSRKINDGVVTVDSRGYEGPGVRGEDILCLWLLGWMESQTEVLLYKI